MINFNHLPQIHEDVRFSMISNWFTWIWVLLLNQEEKYPDLKYKFSHMNKFYRLIKISLFFAGLLIILFLIHSCHSPSGNIYYVSSSGNDSQDGSQNHPWKSLDKASRTDLKPGDRLCFKAGDTFSGCLNLQNDSGLTGKPVIISSYGEGKAMIDGGNGTGIRISDCKNILVRDLKITGSGRKINQNGSGIDIVHSSYVTIDNLETSGFSNAGVWITGCDSVLISRVHAFENGFAGIGTGHEEQTTRIVVRNCVTDNNPGNPNIKSNHSGSGILLASVKNGLIEYCEASFNGWDMPRLGNGPVGIWTWNSDSVVIQYCLSHHNKSPGMDGGGFDLDGGVTNSVVQYNFSHHNAGAGYLVCQFAGAPRDLAGNHIRFNVSLDDGLGCHYAGIMIYVGGELFKENWFYNNTIINTFHSALNIDGAPLYLKNPPQLYFYNNLFISGKDQISNLNLLPGTILQGNLYWAYGDGGFSIGGIRNFSEWVEKGHYEQSDDTTVGSYINPLINTDFSILPLHPDHLRQFALFKPLEKSPLLDNGIMLSGKMDVSNIQVDFFGTPFDKNDRFIGAGK
jgi:hypothetical protein